MQIRRSVIDSPMVKWSLFSLVLAVGIAWAGRDVLLRAGQMKPADTPVSAFSAMTAGSRTKAVVLLHAVDGRDLKGKLLERETDTVYRTTSAPGSSIEAVLKPDTFIVMGKPADIVPGAIVQISGTLNANHSLQTDQIVILTGYVHLSEAAR